MTRPGSLGTTAAHKPGNWVQTERKAHEEWAGLIARKPRAAALLHHLVAQMGSQNAVVVSQRTLSKLMGCHLETVKRAIRDLAAERWIQVVKMNGPGTVCAYVVNDRVAFQGKRENMRFSLFSATIIADAEDQEPLALEHSDLRRIPALFPGERQLPSGPGAEPPSQPAMPGMEPDLPAIVRDESGWEFTVDKETGELQGRLPGLTP
jgi:DNA-binding transcriptional regulator YhcF (GntR family)